MTNKMKIEKQIKILKQTKKTEFKKTRTIQYRIF